MHNKLGRNIAVWSLIFAVAASATTVTGASAKDVSGGDIQQDYEHTAAVEEKQQLEIHKNVRLAPGDIYNMELQEMGKGAAVAVTSNHPEIVKVSVSGKLAAKKCGTAVITATITDKETIRCVKVTAVVKYDRFMRKAKTGRILFCGKQTQLQVKNLEPDAKITYKSSNKKIASVNKEGVIVGKKAGTAKIYTNVSQNGKKYRFNEKIHVEKKTKLEKISKKQRNEWFSDSGFIGSSIGVGQKMYFESQGSDYLGHPTMMVRGCYSFMNDASKSNTYKVTYKGVPYKARTAVKKSGVKKVFINMGMNDLWESPQGVYKRYVSYLKGIRKDNPGIVIFIESTTPVAKGNEHKNLSNKNVNALNQMMQTYCSSQKDMYYIDVNTCLKDATGSLPSKYSSDGYVHLSMAGYAQWMKALCKYTDKLMLQEQKAEDAVKTAQSSGNLQDYRAAQETVSQLEKSTIKSKYKDRLKKAKAKGQALKKTAVAQDEQKSENAETESTEPENTEIENTETENTETIVPLPQAVFQKITAKSNTSLKLEWKKEKEAGYYRIYRASKKQGDYQEIAGTKNTCYTDKSCEKHKTYYYKIQACISKEDESRNSKLSKAMAGRTKNQPKSVVFAGDSITEGLKTYHQLEKIKTPGKKRVIAHRGLGTLSFQTNGVFGGKTAVDKIIDYQPDRLYLMLGMNEVSYRNQKDMLKNYAEILQQIQEESPKTEIVLVSVAPVTRNVTKTNKGFHNIAKWNRNVKKLAKEYQCYYMDCTNTLADSKGYLKYNGGDGIHWNLKGYGAFVKQIIRFEKKINQ